ncbi:tRNA glutamyl-Q(34) synthetase GluQRS [Alteromonas lipolytica]|uniref:Glutamyl-Q tRNA(Asp) synthetase n=1 Tax=Alteromonas lipolytica TaxID=1856405 RepID=A0A1E8FJL4_9ALTE|nr:tRNA glutamyl-Q(34) synthetase GluQRS [Alteromonas lipolytica]OFI36131.1 tRNA glutamyl-Q(34) synthetase GluQRS [Alteromonas lipolytica]GGF86183.1 glutamyl-Q tRNA(Asp) synthetase [Alteromonas lipolytica]
MTSVPISSTHYVGRFAPSPTGPLHFGSLIAALASYLDAKAHNGTWLVRMEDIDAPRCIAGADKQILDCLAAHELIWDGKVRYQSAHLGDYDKVLAVLRSQQVLYACQCTRKQIKSTGGVYTGTCRELGLAESGNALRFKCDQPVTTFNDNLLGPVEITDPHALEDTVLRRRDGLHSYNLVVVADDIAQGVNHIVRGSDLLATTAAHLTLYRQLGEQPPAYAHIPVAATSSGRKLSKQNHARPLDNRHALNNLQQALTFLGFADIASNHTTTASLLSAAINAWQYNSVPKQHEIIVDGAESTYHNGPEI